MLKLKCGQWSFVPPCLLRSSLYESLLSVERLSRSMSSWRLKHPPSSSCLQETRSSVSRESGFLREYIPAVFFDELYDEGGAS